MEYELYHYGVLGMHWGIRRYQNKDGSLTAAGRKRYEKKYTDIIDESNSLADYYRTTKNAKIEQERLNSRLLESKSIKKVYDGYIKDNKALYDEYKKKAEASKQGSLKRKYYEAVAKSAKSDMQEYYRMKMSEIRTIKGIEKRIKLLSENINI